MGITLWAVVTCYCTQLGVRPDFCHLPCQFSPLQRFLLLHVKLVHSYAESAKHCARALHLDISPQDSYSGFSSFPSPFPLFPFQLLLLRGVWILSFENSHVAPVLSWSMLSNQNILVAKRTGTRIVEYLDLCPLPNKMFQFWF